VTNGFDADTKDEGCVGTTISVLRNEFINIIHQSVNFNVAV